MKSKREEWKTIVKIEGADETAKCEGSSNAKLGDLQ